MPYLLYRSQLCMPMVEETITQPLSSKLSNQSSHPRRKKRVVGDLSKSPAREYPTSPSPGPILLLPLHLAKKERNPAI